MAKTEQTYSPAPSDANGPGFRVIQVPTDGSQDPTLPAPDMEVVVLADSAGNLTDDFRATRRREEMQTIMSLDARAMSMSRRHYERAYTTDRRGSVERGTLR